MGVRNKKVETNFGKRKSRLVRRETIIPQLENEIYGKIKEVVRSFRYQDNCPNEKGN